MLLMMPVWHWKYIWVSQVPNTGVAAANKDLQGTDPLCKFFLTPSINVGCECINLKYDKSSLSWLAYSMLRCRFHLWHVAGIWPMG